MVKWMLAIVLAVVLSHFVASGLALAQPTQSPDPAVTVTQAKRECFRNTIQVTGVLVAKKEILVRPDRTGQITQVEAQLGDVVKSGQPLARIVPEGQPGGSFEVQAPAAGVITFSSAVVGSVASPIGAPLFQIAEREEMELLAETTIKTLQSLQPNQPATIEVVGVGALRGKIRLVSNAINQTTQLGQIRVSVEGNPGLRVGAFGRAIIDLGQSCRPAVPLSAVLYAPSGSVVQVVRDNRVQTRPVTMGLIAGGQVEIRDGVAEGEMVIARAGAFFRDGDLVRGVIAGEGTPRK